MKCKQMTEDQVPSISK